ncbi:hypothetical protein LCGC14_2515530 [marine sediment metagenome]|uniref:Uncharacterized protein n=1 Tax=marine sediment metagenome TaxID=412755 RepID=A0A0F9D9H3_9ZZZZ
MNHQYPTYNFQIDNVDELYREVFEKWCKENCAGCWNIDGHSCNYNSVNTVTIGIIRVRFSKEADAVAFKLKWM